MVKIRIDILSHYYTWTSIKVSQTVPSIPFTSEEEISAEYVFGITRLLMDGGADSKQTTTKNWSFLREEHSSEGITNLITKVRVAANTARQRNYKFLFIEDEKNKEIKSALVKMDEKILQQLFFSMVSTFGVKNRYIFYGKEPLIPLVPPSLAPLVPDPFYDMEISEPEDNSMAFTHRPTLLKYNEYKTLDFKDCLQTKNNFLGNDSGDTKTTINGTQSILLMTTKVPQETKLETAFKVDSSQTSSQIEKSTKTKKVPELSKQNGHEPLTAANDSKSSELKKPNSSWLVSEIRKNPSDYSDQKLVSISEDAVKQGSPSVLNGIRPLLFVRLSKMISASLRSLRNLPEAASKVSLADQIKRLKNKAPKPTHGKIDLLASATLFANNDTHFDVEEFVKFGGKRSDINDEFLELLVILCPNLTSLNLAGCKEITDEGRNSLRQVIPNLQILF